MPSATSQTFAKSNHPCYIAYKEEEQIGSRVLEREKEVSEGKREALNYWHIIHNRRVGEKWEIEAID